MPEKLFPFPCWVFFFPFFALFPGGQLLILCSSASLSLLQGFLFTRSCSPAPWSHDFQRAVPFLCCLFYSRPVLPFSRVYVGSQSRAGRTSACPFLLPPAGTAFPSPFFFFWSLFVPRMKNTDLRARVRSSSFIPVHDSSEETLVPLLFV